MSKKISEFLQEIDPWGIYISAKMREDFKKETEMEPAWEEYTEHQTKKAILARGLGGTVAPTDGEKVCWGYRVAVCLAEHYVEGFHSTKMGRGFAFYEAVDALQKAGL